MPSFPISLQLEDKKCVVIGGGTIAERKAETLVEFGARVVLAAPKITPLIRRLVDEGHIEYLPTTYDPTMLEGAFLVIAGTDDRAVNRAVSEDAQALRIPVNVIDDPALCTFIMPAIVRRGDLVISISTGGKSPFVARYVRETLEQEFGPEYEDLLDFLGELRSEVKSVYPSMEDQTLAFRRILDSNVRKLLATGRREEAMTEARKCI